MVTSRWLLQIILMIGFVEVSYCQVDTVAQLSEITINGLVQRNTLTQLAPIVGTQIFSGKKTEVLSISQLDGNIAEKTGRQLFAKVPGVFVYDMEGGNQLNIATRGLDPHRGWEFNLRKDGIITNSDLYGYPASHYSIPMESVERIEIVRGTGSLQYGAQFGGMINYITKNGNLEKKLAFESHNTVGSFGLLSTYNAVGGSSGKWEYYTYMSQRSRGGYRANEHTDYNGQGAKLTYRPSKSFSITFDYVRSHYLYKIPGPLTDALFADDPRQSTRARNYFSPTIHIPSISIQYAFGNRNLIQLTTSAVLGRRNSVIFDRPANVADTILSTGQYASRQVDIDRFNSKTNELRFLHKYHYRKRPSGISIGIQYLHNHLHRTQLGKGTTASNYDLTLVDPIWGRDLHLKTRNLAIFAENITALTDKLDVNIGFRTEMGTSHLTGKIVYYPENDIPVKIEHQYPLFGAGFNFKMKDNVAIYGGISQTFRPLLFKDLIPSSTFERIDPNIRDAKGYNAEVGIKGTTSRLRWDVTAFALQYKNRYGTIAIEDGAGSFITYKSNIGSSMTIGIENFIQVNIISKDHSSLNVFTSTSLMNGRYRQGSVKIGNENKDIKGHQIEGLAPIISRTGIHYQYRRLSVTALFSYTDATYADALNTTIPSATGAVGKVPSYGIYDISATFKMAKWLTIKSSVNNILDHQYFTKRPLFYPGPGVWPSDGRGINITAIVQGSIR